MLMPETVRYRNKGTGDTGCRNVDNGGIDLDADAQLWVHEECAESVYLR
jgi:hypothetical protein